MKIVNRLLSNKFVLYFTAFVALMNVLGYLLHRDIRSLTFFVVLGYLSSYFSKNMIVNLLVAILGTNILMTNKSLREGLENGGEEEFSEEDEEGFKEMKPAKYGGRRKKKKKAWEEENDEDDGVARIDSAATMAATYKNLESVLGTGGMRNLAKDTKSLVEQQKGLMKSVEQMQPMMKQLGGMVKGFGGVEGIKNLMGTVGKMKGGLKQ
jgi:hypothetical protein